MYKGNCFFDKIDKYIMYQFKIFLILFWNLIMFIYNLKVYWCLFCCILQLLILKWYYLYNMYFFIGCNVFI